MLVAAEIASDSNTKIGMGIYHIHSFIHSFIIVFISSEITKCKVMGLYRQYIGILNGYQANGTNGSPENLRSRTY